MKRLTHHRSSGFTIVELMIALSVLSTLLLLASLTLIAIGRLYSKNVNEISAQNTARNLVNDIASQIQLAGNVPAFSYGGVAPTDPTGVTGAAPQNTDRESSVRALCIGNRRYTYVLNYVQSATSDPGGQAYQHVLWRDTLQSAGTCPTQLVHLDTSYPSQGDSATIDKSGSDLLPAHMRLTDLSINLNPSSNTWTIRVTVAYGDKGSPPNEARDDIVQFNSNGFPNTDSTSCSSSTGTEYCAVASLTKTVVQRVSQE